MPLLLLLNSNRHSNLTGHGLSSNPITSCPRHQQLATFWRKTFATELRQQQCQDLASLLRGGKARRGILQRQGRAFTGGQRDELRARAARLRASPQRQGHTFTGGRSQSSKVNAPGFSAPKFLSQLAQDVFKHGLLLFNLLQEQKDELAEREAILVSPARASSWRADRRGSGSWKIFLQCSQIKPRACRCLRSNFRLRRTQPRTRELGLSCCRSRRTSWPSRRPEPGDRESLQRQLAKFLTLLENRAKCVESLQSFECCLKL